MDLLTLVISTIIVGAVFLLYFIHHQRTYWSEKGIPYVKPFPLLGNMSVVFSRQKSMAQFIQDSYNLFPTAKYHGVMDFNTPTIMLKDPDIIKDVCVKNFDHSPNHRSFIDERMDPIMSKNVFSLKDDRWREVRSTLSPSFTASKMKFMFQLVSKCSEDFTQYLLDHPELAENMEMKDAFTRYTNDVIATAAFGISVDSMRNRDNEFYLRGKDATSFTGIIKVAKFIAGRCVPTLMRLCGQGWLSSSTNKFFLNLVTETVRTRDEQKIVRPDMIHLLMQARNNTAGIEMTIEDIIAQAFIFFLAGFDTSSTFMSFLTHSLAFNSDVQDKLRQEVDEVAEKHGGTISYDVLADLKYMDMVMNEVLRLYPPAVATDRVCVEPFKLPKAMDGFDEVLVEKGNICWILIYGLHHDPKYFPDPEKFDPERFNDERKGDIVANTFLPFGLGPRKCIGERFAVMETKIILANLIQKFIIKPTDKTMEKIVFDTSNLNLACKGGIWLNFEKRRTEIHE